MRIIMKVDLEDNGTDLHKGEEVDTLDHVALDFIGRGWADPAPAQPVKKAASK